MNVPTRILPIAMAALLGACAAQPVAEVPAPLRAGSGERLVLAAAATGVQIYECRARKAGAGYEWTFVAPDAQLMDARGRRIGDHGAGPYWQAIDGSRVVGAVKARADAPAAGAIPWLLLDAKSSGRTGVLDGVTSIQRVNTVGGVAPDEACEAQSAGRQARVKYAADYYFYGRVPVPLNFY